MISLFSFTDAVHDHTTIGVRRGCVACAQTEADMALSRAALSKGFRESKPVGAAQPDIPTDTGPVRPHASLGLICR